MQNFDLNLYKVFCTVVQTKSISKAAEQLFVSHQAVSYSIKQLESSLGGQLFFRTPKGVVLTPEAEELYEHIKDSFNCINIGERIFTENIESLNGNIYIGCNPSNFSSCLCKYIDKFHKLYPNIKINITGKPVNDLIVMLKEHELDMVIRKFPEDTAYKNFSIKMFDTVEGCFFCNKDFKHLADKKTVSLKELSNTPLLLLTDDNYERQYIDNIFKKNNLELHTIMEFTNHAPLIHLVKLGLGVGYALKESISQELKNDELFELNTQNFSNEINVGVVFDENYLSCNASKFIDVL